MTTTENPQTQPVAKRRWLPALIVFLGMGILFALRATSELELMRESGSDPQMPIWIMWMAVKLSYWLLAGGVVAGVLFLKKPRYRIALGVILLLGWSHAIQQETWKNQNKQRVLAEARDPATPSARLEQLLQFPDTQDGYELDNRIAANPNATADILRRLYGRHQLGTLMLLARNPNTPRDILQAMVDHDLTRVNQDLENEWIRKCLKKNPHLPDAIRRKLDELKPSVTK